MKEPCRSEVSYTYDEMNQLTSMSTDIGTETVQVNYTYDYLGNVKTISQNGFTYEINYDLNNNITSIDLKNMTSLVQYTYTAGNNLKTAKYANGSKATYTYDRHGNVVAEDWSNKDNIQAQYAYTYDEDGNVIKTLDKKNKLLYTYKYSKGQLHQSEEYTYTDETGVERDLKFRTEYQYTDGVLSRKTDVYANGDTEDRKEYEYHYFDEKDKFTLVLPTDARAVIGTDHFGRKTFDELQLGTGFVSREYTYVAGAYDKEKLSGNLKSMPETDLVQRIAFNNGKALSYTYDEAGNITAVRNENGELLEEYTYDLLGRLKTERNTKGGFYVVYEYDAGGNILSKKRYTVDGVTLQKEDTYRYNDTWKDMLLSYNGEAIAYDASGNPTLYRGKTATWEKGRQLKSFGANTYKYNASGVRISKTVDGVEHRYFVDGIKVLREEFGSHMLDFLYGVDGEAVGFTDNGTAYYYYKNLQGDIIGITDKDGVLIATYTYDAWGKPISVVGDLTIANLNPIRYRGYYYDIETGLYYLNSRYYDPEICRFINADDALMRTLYGINCNSLFAYCQDAPVEKKDINGYIDFSSYYTESWIFKLLGKYATHVEGKLNYQLWYSKLGLTLSCGVGFKYGKEPKVTKKSFTANFKGGSLSLGWGNKLEYKFDIDVGKYTLGYMRGIEWTKSYFAFTISYTTKNKKFTGYCEFYISINHLLKLAIAALIVGACVVLPALSPVFSSAVAALSAGASKLVAIVKTLLPLAACLA